MLDSNQPNAKLRAVMERSLGKAEYAIVLSSRLLGEKADEALLQNSFGLLDRHKNSLRWFALARLGQFDKAIDLATKVRDESEPAELFELAKLYAACASTANDLSQVEKYTEYRDKTIALLQTEAGKLLPKFLIRDDPEFHQIQDEVFLREFGFRR